MNTSEVLNKAADLIEERGWVQGASGWPDGLGPLCLEGGIMAALGLSTTEVIGYATAHFEFMGCPAYRAVGDYIGRKGILFHWNDDNGRTASEVIETLRAAALIEAAKEVDVHVVAPVAVDA